MQESKALTLRRNFSWTFIGNAVYAGCQWGMLVVLAKLGSPEMVGQFTLGLAVTAPVIMFTNLQLRTVQATDAKKQYFFSDYLGLRLTSVALALLIIVVISLSGGYRWETSLVILLIGLAKTFESISDVFYGLIQQHERMDRIAVSLMIKGSLSLLLLGIGVYISGSVLWGAVGLVFAWAIVLFSYDIGSGLLILKQRSKLQPSWQLKTLTNLVWLCLPLGFVMMLISLNTNIPRYFIEHYLGERELGIFAALAYLMVAGGMVVSALGQSASPRLAKYYAVGNYIAFRTLLLKLVGIAALLGGTGVLIAVIGGRHVLTFLYRPEYAEQTNLFTWLMVVAGINYISSFLGYGMTAARYFRIQMPLFSTVVTISAIACLWLLPRMGLIGAAIALIIAAIVQVVFSSVVIIHALHKHPQSIKLIENK
ncbi:oligosaccharide flippase family protein [Nostoc sp. CENA67]|uniref:Oligosaccharide flippase family protein n=1 Tax=Amazonocrinis nigriterrae CENA67 TaxID=2794033 RepID=A0A8J7HTZ2_9NOST|nr:oligosaccharide flippase family protein [Amazonocrinis nigriterrae]MBH8562370.1 oligosaccharide flippase family protein [Amazonocrinis nigriterrae CENA67]MBH8562409.1 oligosaccharide flippase family protein [Amazonocrinis nigriterrae CENA67]